MLNQAANTQSDSPIGSLSVQVSRSAGVAMSVVYPVRRQMDSGDKSSTRCPSRCMLRLFPSVLLCSRGATQTSSVTTFYYLCWRNKRQMTTAKGFHIRIISVHSGKVVHPRLLPTTRAQCYYQPAQCQLATILVPFKIERSTLCSAVPT